jgi:hypothetical protein
MAFELFVFVGKVEVLLIEMLQDTTAFVSCHLWLLLHHPIEYISWRLAKPQLL